MANSPKKTTLTDTEVQSRRGGLGRRAFLLGAFGGSTALAGCVTTSITDSDTGRYADPAGGGRGSVGLTDSDSGRYADPAGRGRGAQGITDSDTGRYADPVGRGRGRNCTDADGGAYADPVGRGRRC
ncbi:MAG: hypothetical protein H6900_14935 [Rhodobacter sp.]|uniref:hypothetical protein n=1 Tax=Pararhodobacter sp. TaxID=2127056 RepID=UPI001DCBE3EA|nr:hypothetical protein [Pararhodobacter sp.]MCB1346616.1 hypothetical protein [Paracoccaceae bacterium]MCC0074576.1 hypothetical protein [Rhodobacter sp.]HPD92523.1 hypothetical protein [Pararhodobacter sp.]